VDSLNPELHDISLAAALRRMPLESPAQSAWPLLAARVAPDRRRPRWPMAIAAGLLALLLLPRDLPTTKAPATLTPAANAAAGSVEMAALMSESSRLERLVAVANDDGATSAAAAAFSLELEDRLQTLDSALEANPDPAQQLALWKQRVQLLRGVAAMEASRHYLAAEGRSFDVALVAAY
jgi:hypothetical protein